MKLTETLESSLSEMVKSGFPKCISITLGYNYNKKYNKTIPPSRWAYGITLKI